MSKRISQSKPSTFDADYWWTNNSSGLLEQAEGDFGWDLFKRAMQEKFYPLHVRKDKSNEFARLEMGGMTVDEYYHKFMEYLKYCPDDMYRRASQIGNILRKEKEKEKDNVPEKRKEGGGSNTTSGFRSDAKPAKPLLDRDGNERKYFCRRCKRNHPGKDCDGNLIECNFCHKRGYRELECYIKKGGGSQHPSGQHRQHNLNNAGSQASQQYGNGNRGNAGQRFQRPFYGGQGRVDGNRVEGSEMHRGGNQVGGNNVQPESGKVSAASAREADQATDVVTGTCEKLYRDVPLRIGKVVFPSDLYMIDMEGLEVILGMDWLGRYNATIECREQRAESFVGRTTRGKR
ncbi:uncharacterized protein LOC130818575 [Amaranthus tricolor]|uniref:uncharacterized protein LOC130818575 n=1 Tax=Amaranthus tricolor TaxID=29722 RepID=UPI0025904D56|nr:uncharacterized protein LOC130818575 [Amaranthus tricolor]